MPVLTVRVDDDVARSLRVRAGEQGVSVSELVRRALGALVAPADTPGTGGEPVDVPALSIAMRHQLAVLHRIAARIESNQLAAYHREAADIFEQGRVNDYAAVFDPARRADRRPPTG